MFDVKITVKYLVINFAKKYLVTNYIKTSQLKLNYEKNIY